MEKMYAFVKDNTVINKVVFDDPSEELLQHFLQEFNLDHLIEITEKVIIGDTYDGSIFWGVKPFESWVKGDTDWVAPLPLPSTDKAYDWDETTVSWAEIEKPYESWTVIDNKWAAPTPQPTPQPNENKVYIWNEIELQWKEVVIDFDL